MRAEQLVNRRVWLPAQAAGLTLKEEPHTMRVPRSQRGGDIVEPLVREQWFVRAGPLAKPALQVPSWTADATAVTACHKGAYHQGTDTRTLEPLFIK